MEAKFAIYKEIFPKLFETEEMITFNHDLIESYQASLGKYERWIDYIKMKRVVIDHYCAQAQPDHRARRGFLEIVCCQVLIGDHFCID